MRKNAFERDFRTALVHDKCNCINSNCQLLQINARINTYIFDSFVIYKKVWYAREIH